MNVLHWFQIAYLTASLGQTRISTNHTGPTHIIYTIKSYIDIALKATIKTSKFAFYICDSWHLIVIVLIFVFKNLIRYLTESELIHLQRIKCNFFFMSVNCESCLEMTYLLLSILILFVYSNATSVVKIIGKPCLWEMLVF